MTTTQASLVMKETITKLSEGFNWLSSSIKRWEELTDESNIQEWHRNDMVAELKKIKQDSFNTLKELLDKIES